MVKFIAFGLEAAVALAILAFVYAQLVRPLVRKTPVFPLFRRTPLERELEDVNERLDEKAERATLESKRRQLND